MCQLKIKLYRGNQYPQLKRKAVIGDSLGYDLTVKKGKFLSPKNTSVVEGLGPCLQFFLWSPNKIFNSHSAPELDQVSDVKKRIVEYALALKDDIKNKTQGNNSLNYTISLTSNTIITVVVDGSRMRYDIITA